MDNDVREYTHIGVRSDGEITIDRIIITPERAEAMRKVLNHSAMHLHNEWVRTNIKKYKQLSDALKDIVCSFDL